MAKEPTKVAAKVAGKAKAAGKALKGYHHVLRHLAEEHGEAATLMARIAGSPDTSDARRQLFEELRFDLLSHAKSEESEFYPVLEGHEPLRDLVERSLDQHRGIEERLERLDAGDENTLTWTKEFERLKAAVEAHVQLEEERIFPLVKELLSDEQLDEMAEGYESREEELRSELR